MKIVKLALLSLLIFLSSASLAYGQREGREPAEQREVDLHLERDSAKSKPEMYERNERSMERGFELYRQLPELTLTRDILIINDSDSKVHFSLKNKDSDWCHFDLDKAAESTYKNVDEIKVETDGKGSVDYALELNQRYKIYWNTDSNKWDVAKLVPKP